MKAISIIKLDDGFIKVQKKGGDLVTVADVSHLSTDQQLKVKNKAIELYRVFVGEYLQFRKFKTALTRYIIAIE